MLNKHGLGATMKTTHCLTDLILAGNARKVL